MVDHFLFDPNCDLHMYGKKVVALGSGWEAPGDVRRNLFLVAEGGKYVITECDEYGICGFLFCWKRNRKFLTC